MPAHPERIRRHYSSCFETGHNWMVINNSDIAPYIGPTGLRVIWRMCTECGEKKSFTMTQKEFEARLNR